MASYVGETFEITNVATDFDASALDPAHVTSVVVEIADSASPPHFVLTNTPMTWDPVRLLWFYLWNTGTATPPVAGTYVARVTLTGLDGTASFNYLKIRLKTAPF